MRTFVQLALDFLAPPPEPVAPPHGPNFNKNSALPLDSYSNVATNIIANDPQPIPTAPPGGLLAPAVFRHPQARRELRLGDAVVGYALTRARRRSIGFSVGAEGLSVRAPQWVTLASIDEALLERADWILRQLAQMQERARRQRQAQVQWCDGVVLPYLGGRLCVRLDPGAPVAGRWQDATADAPAQLTLGLPAAAAAHQIRDAVQAWMGRSARAHFCQRLDHFAPRMGVRWQRLLLSNARTRWGSARSDGTIRLNWRLMHLAPELLDYVVVHELAHLRVMDHSPRFWAEVAAVLPEHPRLRQRLNDAAQDTEPVWDGA